MAPVRFRCPKSPSGSPSGDPSDALSGAPSTNLGMAAAVAEAVEGAAGDCDEASVALSVNAVRPEEAADPCVICLEPFTEEGERLVKIKRCRCTKTRLYHEPCLRQWLKADASCPQCRACS